MDKKLALHKIIYKLVGYLFILILIVSTLIFFIIRNTSPYVMAEMINKLIPQTNVYFDTTNLPWAKELREHANEIKAEYDAYVHSGKKLPNISHIEAAMPEHHASGPQWLMVVLRAYNQDTVNMQFFPKLQQFLKDVPGCSTVMFSILEPGKILPLHQGPYRGVLRYHLGLEIPPIQERDNCKIIINNIPYTWKFGEDVLFDDTYEHEAINKTNHTRVVLFLNVEKPLSGYIKYINKLFLFLLQYNQIINEVVHSANKVVFD